MLDIEHETLPIYLSLPPADARTHGTLRKDPKTGLWELEAEPQAVIMAKRDRKSVV